MPRSLPLDGRSLDLAGFLEVVRGGRPVAIASGAREALARGRGAVERAVAEGRPVYGVTTGLGALSREAIPSSRAREQQNRLIRSHASGTGAALPADVVRGMILLRLNSLLRGVSGVRPELADALADLLNHPLTPWIPEQGSVGASGDLAPLAHLGLALMGEGRFLESNGVGTVEGVNALDRAGLAPYSFHEKEAIALVNGTSLMASYLALAVLDARRLLDAALVAAALSFDALEGDPGALDRRLGEVRNLPAQQQVAAALRALLQGSELAVPPGSWRGQDPYTLRCLPQVYAAVVLALDFAEGIARAELNAVSDNPLVFEHDEFVSGGNFHGQPLALALDTLALGIQYLGGFSERRIARLLNPALNRGLPPFLAPPEVGGSGWMITQYLAAALVNENATLTVPASATSLPTSADQEDFVSMGPWAGVKLRRAMENARRIVAVEWIVAGQALEFRHPRKGGGGSEAAWKALRQEVAPWTADRPPAPDIDRIALAIADGRLVEAVRSVRSF